MARYPAPKLWRTQEMLGPIVGLRVSLVPIPGFTDPAALRAELLLQCSPTEDFGPSYTWSYTDYATVGSGMRSRPMSRELAVVTFSSLFVDTDYPWVHWKGTAGDPANPVHLAGELKTVGDAMAPFLLLAGQPALWGIDYDVRMPATLRSFQPVERAGEPDSRYYTASFTEFRGIPEAAWETAWLAAAGAAGAGGGKTVLATVLVRSLPVGQRTLRQLAKHYYGQVTGWRAIAKANGLTSMGPDTNLVAYFKSDPTRRLVIPRLQPQTTATTQTIQSAGGGGTFKAV